MFKYIIPLFLLLSLVSSSRDINYPVRVAYVDAVLSWWPPQVIAAGMCVPGFAQQNIYNYIILAFWITTGVADFA
jgi:hypothetical protein